MAKTRFTIPTEILALLRKPPLLKGESVQEYNDLLKGLIVDIGPNDTVEWLWLLQFLDCIWEIFRNRHFRAILIDLQRGPALRSVILKTAPFGQMTAKEVEAAVAQWTANPDQFSQHGIDPQSVPACSLVQVAKHLETIDRILERLQRRCDSILQQLEYRRELFASRARHAAETILNAECIEVSCSETTAPLAIQAPDPNQVAPDEVTTVPKSPESNAANPEEASTEESVKTPSADS